MPAAAAAGVVVSSHLLRAVHTCVREVSVLTSRPFRSSESSLPGGGVGDSGPSMPHSSSGVSVSSPVHAKSNKQARYRFIVARASSMQRAGSTNSKRAELVIEIDTQGRRQQLE
jgi:hypothetical protein